MTSPESGVLAGTHQGLSQRRQQHQGSSVPTCMHARPFCFSDCGVSLLAPRGTQQHQDLSRAGGCLLPLTWAGLVCGLAEVPVALGGELLVQDLSVLTPRSPGWQPAVGFQQACDRR